MTRTDRAAALRGRIDDFGLVIVDCQFGEFQTGRLPVRDSPWTRSGGQSPIINLRSTIINDPAASGWVGDWGFPAVPHTQTGWQITPLARCRIRTRRALLPASFDSPDVRGPPGAGPPWGRFLLSATHRNGLPDRVANLHHLECPGALPLTHGTKGGGSRDSVLDCHTRQGEAFPTT